MTFLTEWMSSAPTNCLKKVFLIIQLVRGRAVLLPRVRREGAERTKEGIAQSLKTDQALKSSNVVELSRIFLLEKSTGDSDDAELANLRSCREDKEQVALGD